MQWRAAEMAGNFGTVCNSRLRCAVLLLQVRSYSVKLAKRCQKLDSKMCGMKRRKAAAEHREDIETERVACPDVGRIMPRVLPRAQLVPVKNSAAQGLRKGSQRTKRLPEHDRAWYDQGGRNGGEGPEGTMKQRASATPHRFRLDRMTTGSEVICATPLRLIARSELCGFHDLLTRAQRVQRGRGGRTTRLVSPHLISHCSLTGSLTPRAGKPEHTWAPPPNAVRTRAQRHRHAG